MVTLTLIQDILSHEKEDEGLKYSKQVEEVDLTDLLGSTSSNMRGLMEPMDDITYEHLNFSVDHFFGI
jgi:hypothetical protein